ncbi:hypothetical protein [Herbidospora cretacea]|uniref:hypothetical protein n=1 Tax=Herbidospora cretacea TaxID=28444 RepID=UPI000773EA9A|nr:hypothetical protein [Herbidospora cretacea]
MSVKIPYRPAAVNPATGMMNVDGIFVVNMGQQAVRAGILNTETTALRDVRIYIEGFSDPGISQLGDVRTFDEVPPGAEIGAGLRADFTHATPGETDVSFIIESQGQPFTRVIKKIFVTRIDFDKATKTYSAVTPQGTMRMVMHRAIVGPDDYQDPKSEEEPKPPYFVIPVDLTYEWVPAVPYEGERGPYPFEDPLWKIVLGIVAALIAAGAALYDYFSDGTLDGGLVSVSGTFQETDPSVKCCTKVETKPATGTTQDHVAKGLYGAAGAVATIAVASDGEDPHYRGQAATIPPPGERTIAESVRLRYDYLEPPNPGQPFQILGAWDYTRTTDGGVYTYSVSEQRENTHVAADRVVDVPDVFDRQNGPLMVRAQFTRPGGMPYQGGELYVLGVITSPDGKSFPFEMQDNGMLDDSAPGDGWYCGLAGYGGLDGGPYGSVPHDGKEWPSAQAGDWLLFVIAQDVNLAREGMSPHEAAQYIGGLPITDQLRLQFNDKCVLVADKVVTII